MANITVEVLVAGVYNTETGYSLRAQVNLPHAEVGDVIEVAGGSYCDSLIRDKYVRPWAGELPGQSESIPGGVDAVAKRILSRKKD